MGAEGPYVCGGEGGHHGPGHGSMVPGCSPGCGWERRQRGRGGTGTSPCWGVPAQSPAVHCGWSWPLHAPWSQEPSSRPTPHCNPSLGPHPVRQPDLAGRPPEPEVPGGAGWAGASSSDRQGVEPSGLGPGGPESLLSPASSVGFTPGTCRPASSVFAYLAPHQVPLPGPGSRLICHP